MIFTLIAEAKALLIRKKLAFQELAYSYHRNRFMPGFIKTWLWHRNICCALSDENKSSCLPEVVALRFDS